MKNNIPELIEMWSNTFGLPVNTSPQIPSKERIKLAFSLIEEEVGELQDSLFYSRIFSNVREDIELAEVYDASVDAIWCIIRLMQEFGLDVHKGIEAVYKSNMSKACKNVIELQQSIDLYKEKEIEVGYKLINWKNTETAYIIFNKETGKVLKGINFKEPKFDI